MYYVASSPMFSSSAKVHNGSDEAVRAAGRGTHFRNIFVNGCRWSLASFVAFQKFPRPSKRFHRMWDCGTRWNFIAKAILDRRIHIHECCSKTNAKFDRTFFVTSYYCKLVRGNVNLKTRCAPSNITRDRTDQMS